MRRSSESHWQLMGWAGILCGTVLLLSGCGGAPSSRSGGGEVRKTLNYTIGNDISNMDPAQITDIESAIVATQVYEGLVAFKDGTVEVEPALARSWSVSEDGLTWTFDLHEGAVFSDGAPVDAEAVVTSIERQIYPDHKFHVPGKMRYAKTLFGDPMTSITALVISVRAESATQVVFTLARPYQPFLKNLAMTPAAIVSPRALETYGSDLNTTMVGSGPFMLRQYSQDQSVVLVRNAGYWGDRPPLEEIRFRILRDANVRLNSLRRGESDIISGIPPTALEMLEGDANVAVIAEPSMNLGYIALNNTRAPLDNKLVRQALNYAVDKEYIADTLFLGTSVVAEGVLPPGMLGYKAGRKSYPHDPEKAKALLAEAGFADGLTLTMAAHDRPRVYNLQGIKLAERLQQDLAQAGVTLKIDQMEFPTFLSRQKSGDYETGMSGWVTDNGDPDNFLYELCGRDENDTRYVNAEATALMLRAAGLQDEAERARLYEQAEDLVIEDPPFIFLNHGKQVLAARKRVKNFVPSPTAVASLARVDVDGD